MNKVNAAGFKDWDFYQKIIFAPHSRPKGEALQLYTTSKDPADVPYTALVCDQNLFLQQNTKAEGLTLPPKSKKVACLGF